MPSIPSYRIYNVCLVFISALIAMPSTAGDTLSYNRDVRQILSNTCFKCHGPDERAREAGLRLDTAGGATALLESGKRAIVPGDTSASALVSRITASDSNTMMPPPDSGKILQPEQIEILKQWIAEGAEYERHWSFVKPERPSLPEVSNPSWPVNGLDYFVMARLDEERLQPSKGASRTTLIRRVYLDLIGLPPTPDQIDAFLNDDSAVAYEKVVDDLLASPHFGERWARMWLDIARYADTKGYEADRERTIWRYRDWVIDAFNTDMPFDEFTIEQLAGDLLPEPSKDQLIATAFHRNTMTNDEGGTDDEEFRNAAVVDRVNTTMEAWMGMTMSCAQCHTHKYDPISQKEYFEFFAFLNQTADSDKMNEAPTLKTPTPEQVRLQQLLDDKLSTARERLDAAADALTEERRAWEAETLKRASEAVTFGPWYALPPIAGDSYQQLFDTTYEFETNPDLEAVYVGERAFLEKPDLKDGEVYAVSETNSAFVFYRTVASEIDRPLTLHLGSDDGIRVHLNGEEVHNNPTMRKAAPDQDTVTVNLRPGVNHLVFKVVNGGSAGGFYFRADEEAFPEDLVAALRVDEADRSLRERRTIGKAFADGAPELAPQREALANVTKEIAALEERIPTTPIMQELPPEEQRTTHIQLRGNFMDLGEAVEPDVPETFHDFDADLPRNRLGLAKWLASEDNPLTARVVANRFWEQIFGIGIVETSEDFGTQGELPSNQQLLDWLAVEFMESDWSVKALCRTIVTSATYRQSSDVTEELYARDPYNRLLARGPRFRLAAETVRDQALHVSGLLNEKTHGPSVMPYQPEGVWQIVYNGADWETSPGDARYRRGIYTYWRRTSPYPSMAAFDAPSREVCEVRRIRTNTPLQALVTLNDPVYVEAAQALARRIMLEGGATPEDRAAYGFKLVTCRVPEASELERLIGLFESERTYYSEHPEDAAMLATNPLGPLPENWDPAATAAWTVVSNVLLNLDEALTKT